MYGRAASEFRKVVLSTDTTPVVLYLDLRNVSGAKRTG